MGVEDPEIMEDIAGEVALEGLAATAGIVGEEGLIDLVDTEGVEDQGAMEGLAVEVIKGDMGGSFLDYLSAVS